MSAIERIKQQAATKQKCVILPETEDVRTLHAAKAIVEQGLAKVLLVGEKHEIEQRAKNEGIQFPSEVEYVHPHHFTHQNDVVNFFYEKRKAKGVTLTDAEHTMQQPLYFAAALVVMGFADACVAGAVNTTGDVLRAAIQVIGMKPGSTVVSSVFLMELPDGRTFTYGDCAVVPYPNAAQLASIAVDSADTHQKLTGQTPHVAMLSFSTKGSASHERVALVTEALQHAKKLAPEVMMDGELQFDAALLPAIAKRKAPQSEVAGRANVFIFPNLDAGNIAYKITERLAGATATGPIIQGLAKPMNDLSRGCTWEDIVNTCAVSVLQ